MGRRRGWDGTDEPPSSPNTGKHAFHLDYLADNQEILAPGGRFYLVAVEQNKPLEIIEYMKSLGLDAEVCRADSGVDRRLTPFRQP